MLIHFYVMFVYFLSGHSGSFLPSFLGLNFYDLFALRVLSINLGFDIVFVIR